MVLAQNGRTHIDNVPLQKVSKAVDSDPPLRIRVGQALLVGFRETCLTGREDAPP